MVRGLLLLLNMTGVPRLVFRLLLDGRVPLRLKLILLAALAYLISPFDVLPDLIVPGLGHVDDLLVILAALGLFLGMAPREVVAGHLGRAGPDGTARPRDQRGKVIDGSYRFADEDEEAPRKE